MRAMNMIALLLLRLRMPCSKSRSAIRVPATDTFSSSKRTTSFKKQSILIPSVFVSG